VGVGLLGILGHRRYPFSRLPTTQAQRRPLIRPLIRCNSTIRRTHHLHQQRQGFIPLESVAGGVGEEESALSNKASSLDSIAASRLFSFCSRSISFSISFVRLSLSCSRLSLSCSRLSLSNTLIRASIVGCQLNVAKKRRHGGKEERTSDLLIDREVEEFEEIDKAAGREKGDQSNQQTCRQRRPSHGIQRRRDLSCISRAGI
jgi:hypothetical protein